MECSIDGCTSKARAKGLCRRHGEARWQSPCSIDGCNNPARARTYCSMHYYRWHKTGDAGEGARRRRGKRPCRVGDCQNDAVTATDLCATHRRRKRLYGNENGTLATHKPCAICGEPSMNGMRFVDRCEPHAWDRVLDLHLAGEIAGVTGGKGYVYLNVRKKRRAVHQLVMERLLGRALLPGETPHHKNGRRDDNRPENLELWAKPQIPGQRVQDLVDWVVGRYPEYVRAALDGQPHLSLNEPTNVAPG